MDITSQSIIKLLQLAVGWDNSFFRDFPNNRKIDKVKYIDYVTDTRTRSIWMVGLETPNNREVFSVDSLENFKELLEWLEIPELASLYEMTLDDYVITDEFKIFGHSFMVITHKSGRYFVTYM